VPFGCPFSAGSLQLPYASNGFHRIDILGNSKYSSFTVLGNWRIKETPIFLETNFVSFFSFFSDWLHEWMNELMIDWLNEWMKENKNKKESDASRACGRSFISSYLSLISFPLSRPSSVYWSSYSYWDPQYQCKRILNVLLTFRRRMALSVY
jgi:hypothetical protein